MFSEKYGLKLGEFNNTTGTERVKDYAFATVFMRNIFVALSVSKFNCLVTPLTYFNDGGKGLVEACVFYPKKSLTRLSNFASANFIIYLVSSESDPQKILAPFIANSIQLKFLLNSGQNFRPEKNLRTLPSH